MARRKYREQKSKFYGTKQVLTDINLPAHLAIHDLDAAVVQIPGGGFTGQVLVKNSNESFDVSWSFPEIAVIDGGDSSTVFGVIDGGNAASVHSSVLDGGLSGAVHNTTLDGGSSS